MVVIVPRSAGNFGKKLEEVGRSSKKLEKREDAESSLL